MANRNSVDVKAEAYRIIRDLLRTEWDPIGVGDLEASYHEYDAYAPAIYELVVSGKPKSAIMDYLWWLETEQIGMPGNRAEAERFADLLLQLRADLQRQ